MLQTMRRGLTRLTELHGSSAGRGIFAATMIVGAMTAVTKVASVGKDLLVAHEFGVGDALDAFLIALLLPSFAISVLAGSIPAALIPALVRARETRGREAAGEVLWSTALWGGGFFLAVTAVLAAFGPLALPLLGSGFGPEKMALTEELYYVVLPIVFFGGLTASLTSAMNALDRFALPAAAPGVTPVAIAASIVLLSKHVGIFALAIGTVVGFALETTIVTIALPRSHHKALGPSPRLDPALLDAVRQYLPMVAGAFLMSGTLLVDQAMASMLGTGSVSALSYGNKVVAFLLGIGGLALGTATLPSFSRMAVLERWASIEATVLRMARAIIGLSVPIVIVAIVLSDEIIALLFEHGAFVSDDTATVGFVQGCYLLQVPFYLLGIVIVRLVSALRANHILMWGAILNLCANVVLNLLFMRWIGVAGIALSTSFVYLISVVYLVFMTRRRFREARAGR